MKKSTVIIKNIVLQALTLALIILLLRLFVEELISDFYCVVFLIVAVTASIVVYFSSLPERKLRIFNLVSGLIASAVSIVISLYVLEVLPEMPGLLSAVWNFFGVILYALCAAVCFAVDGIKILSRTSAVKKIYKGLWK